jgi:hypothetical protein
VARGNHYHIDRRIGQHIGQIGRGIVGAILGGNVLAVAAGAAHHGAQMVERTQLLHVRQMHPFSKAAGPYQGNPQLALGWFGVKHHFGGQLCLGHGSTVHRIAQDHTERLWPFGLQALIGLRGLLDRKLTFEDRLQPDRAGGDQVQIFSHVAVFGPAHIGTGP